MRAALTVQLDLLDGDHVADVDAALLRAELLGAESLWPDLEQPATEIFREAVPVERSVRQHKQPLDPVRPHSGGELPAPLVKRRCDTDELVWVNMRDLVFHWLCSDLHSSTLGFLNPRRPSRGTYSRPERVRESRCYNFCAAGGDTEANAHSVQSVQSLPHSSGELMDHTTPLFFFRVR